MALRVDFLTVLLCSCEGQPGYVSVSKANWDLELVLSDLHLDLVIDLEFDYFLCLLLLRRRSRGWGDVKFIHLNFFKVSNCIIFLTN